jgi:hypothetical protein
MIVVSIPQTGTAIVLLAAVVGLQIKQGIECHPFRFASIPF